MISWLRSLVPSRTDRQIARLTPLVDDINAHAEKLAEMDEDDLAARTTEFREEIARRCAPHLEEIARIEDERASVSTPAERDQMAERLHEVEQALARTRREATDELMVPAFATVKAMCRRLVGASVPVMGQDVVWDMVPYDVQLLGAIALHQGTVTEMATGEGKTLVATLPLYLNALVGEGVHLVTVNPYLAERDADWMGALLGRLGLAVDCIDRHAPGSSGRRQAYRADVTYGTNSEFGFDYLRDNMKRSADEQVQRGHYYAIIDEIDSILIDEARTPLIISGPAEQSSAGAYREHQPKVERLVAQQGREIAGMLSAATQALAEGDEMAAGKALLAAKRGAPRSRQLRKLFSDRPALQDLVTRTLNAYTQEKRLHELDDDLLFVVDESDLSVYLSDRGMDVLAGSERAAFTPPDLSIQLPAIEEDSILSPAEREERVRALETEHAAKVERMHVIQNLLRAYTLFNRDEEYILEDGRIVIVDPYTGRKMPSRKWGEGIHQAVEAKEGIDITAETQTLATITLQNYFRMYQRLAGMTGTAKDEEDEFHAIYDLDVLVVPTNRPVRRDDRDDLVFRTTAEKYQALVREVERLHRMELPVLVGTASVETSETLSRIFRRRGIRHAVLNAKQHENEADVVARAGRPGAITIATNMAGRGTDIRIDDAVRADRTLAWLGERGIAPAEVQPVDPARHIDVNGADDSTVMEPGGLHIVGSERHESRRIDRQLRGRAGRQGDPGASQFFVSLEDDLMRLFGSERVARVLDMLGPSQGQPISHPVVSAAIGRAQAKVERQNFDARKELLDYDDVVNRQREVIYDLRSFAVQRPRELAAETVEMAQLHVDTLLERHLPEGDVLEAHETHALDEALEEQFSLVLGDRFTRSKHGVDPEEIAGAVRNGFMRALEQDYQRLGEKLGEALAMIHLDVLDRLWRQHLYELDHLKGGIGFRAYGQTNPLIEYKQEGFALFQDMMERVRAEVLRMVRHARVEDVGARNGQPAGRIVETGPGTTERSKAPERREEPRISRNDPCPCGSGKKYKHCCGRP